MTYGQIVSLVRQITEVARDEKLSKSRREQQVKELISKNIR